MKSLRKTAIIMLSAAAALMALPRLRAEISPERKLLIAESAIANLYVDSVDDNKLVEDAIRGMLEQLDPHSSYTNPEETKEFNEPMAGNFSGIGITFNMNQDTLYVIQTVSGGPSERVGLLAGDRIIAVNDTVIAGVKMKNSKIMKMLRGPKGTDVNVTVLRSEGGSRDTIPFRIRRAEIPIYSVDAAYMADPKTGYIRLNKFSAETAEEMQKAITDLKKQGMTQLILDLTDNGGGYMMSATDMLGELLPAGSKLVYTEGRKSPRQDFTARSKKKEPLFADGRLVVMSNQYSASASEITMGAIQDWDRGVIVGRRSFGKGLVQRPLPLPDGSMIKLTIAHYYTPTGRDIQKPYAKGNSKDYNKDIIDRFNSGELMHEDSIKHVDSLAVKTLRVGRTIYGGGGIYPDKFVPLDTTKFTKYYRNVMAKGVVNRYVIQYVDQHRKEIQKLYKNCDRYAKEFKVTPEMLDAMKQMADKDEIEFNEEQFATSAPLFSNAIKGLIGRDVFTNDTYFKVYNQEDPIFIEALRIINSPEYDTLLQVSPTHGQDN